MRFKKEQFRHCLGINTNKVKEEISRGLTDEAGRQTCQGEEHGLQLPRARSVLRASSGGPVPHRKTESSTAPGSDF